MSRRGSEEAIDAEVERGGIHDSEGGENHQFDTHDAGRIISTGSLVSHPKLDFPMLDAAGLERTRNNSPSRSIRSSGRGTGSASPSIVVPSSEGAGYTLRTPGSVRHTPEPPAIEYLPRGREYHQFYWDCMDLKSELIRLDFALRSVGSGGPLIQAVYSVKKASMKLRDLYGMNTLALSPSDDNVRMYQTFFPFDYLTDFERAFSDFGNALDEMGHALHNFYTIYHDERLLIRLFTLHQRSMEEAHTIYHPGAITERLQCVLTDWLMMGVVSLTGALRDFIDKGIPTIQSAQDSMASRYLNMTTAAFFFAGTAASMLQMTGNASSQTLGGIANTFLFLSLVLSVGSAVNSLLVNSWRKSVVCDPDATLPFWLRVWLNSGPMISLILSGAFFAIGICLFVFTTGHDFWTSGITVAFTVFNATGLAYLFARYILERWHFRWDAGRVGRVLTMRSFLLSGLDWVNSCFARLGLTAPIPGTSFGTLEAGGGIGPRSMDVGNRAIASDRSTSKQVSGKGWHALSDEKFILSSKYRADLVHGNLPPGYAISPHAPLGWPPPPPFSDVRPESAPTRQSRFAQMPSVDEYNTLPMMPWPHSPVPLGIMSESRSEMGHLEDRRSFQMSSPIPSNERVNEHLHATNQPFRPTGSTDDVATPARGEEEQHGAIDDDRSSDEKYWVPPRAVASSEEIAPVPSSPRTLLARYKNEERHRPGAFDGAEDGHTDIYPSSTRDDEVVRATRHHRKKRRARILTPSDRASPRLGSPVRGRASVTQSHVSSVPGTQSSFYPPLQTPQDNLEVEIGNLPRHARTWTFSEPQPMQYGSSGRPVGPFGPAFSHNAASLPPIPSDPRPVYSNQGVRTEPRTNHTRRGLGGIPLLPVAFSLGNVQSAASFLPSSSEGRLYNWSSNTTR